MANPIKFYRWLRFGRQDIENDENLLLLIIDENSDSMSMDLDALSHVLTLFVLYIRSRCACATCAMFSCSVALEYENLYICKVLRKGYFSPHILSLQTPRQVKDRKSPNLFIPPGFSIYPQPFILAGVSGLL